MAKLTIKKRGHSWVLLEGRLGIDAFPTKVRALDEKRRRKLWVTNSCASCSTPTGNQRRLVSKHLP
jgi:hypothetical protein